MKQTLINTENMLPDIQKKFIPYANSLIDLHQDNLISVFLTGDSTGENYIPKQSKITSIFVFNELPLKTLQDSLKIVNTGILKNIAAPLFLTQKHIETSLDVFPMEFLEMKDNHLLVYGKDILSTLTIQEDHIRLFCEEQIKGKLIRIRQAFLEVGLKNKGIEALLKEALHSLLPVFRNLLRLKHQTPPIANQDVCNQLCVTFDLDENVFIPILKDESNDEKINNQDVTIYLEKFIDEINKLATKVDQL